MVIALAPGIVNVFHDGDFRRPRTAVRQHPERRPQSIAIREFRFHFEITVRLREVTARDDFAVYFRDDLLHQVYLRVGPVGGYKPARHKYARYKRATHKHAAHKDTTH